MEIEQHIQNLKDYIRIDKDNINYDNSDFAQFCKGHCEDIQAVLDRLEDLEELKNKFYNGELYTAKQLKNIEQNQKKYFINKQVIKEEIEKLENIKVEGEIFTTAVNFAIKEFQELLNKE